MTRPGPKPGPPGSQRTARLVVRVTPADVEAYKAAAGRAGVSMGEWVRRVMAHDLDCEEEYARGHRDGMRLVAELRLKGEAAAAEKEHGG